jgi:hypothetical protein
MGDPSPTCESAATATKSCAVRTNGCVAAVLRTDHRLTDKTFRQENGVNYSRQLSDSLPAASRVLTVAKQISLLLFKRWREGEAPMACPALRREPSMARLRLLALAIAALVAMMALAACAPVVVGRWG